MCGLTGLQIRSLYELILHIGFPYPDNSDLALHLESTVRQNGGVPATIAVLNGIARVGLSREELQELTASAGKQETRKVSRRDLAHLLGLVIPFFYPPLFKPVSGTLHLI